MQDYNKKLANLKPAAFRTCLRIYIIPGRSGRRKNHLIQDIIAPTPSIANIRDLNSRGEDGGGEKWGYE